MSENSTEFDTYIRDLVDKTKIYADISPESIRQKIINRKTKNRAKRKILSYSIGASSFFVLIGMNIPAFAGTSLMDIIVQRVHVSPQYQGGFIESISFGKHVGPYGKQATKSIQSNSDYSGSIDEFIGTPYPKINAPGYNIVSVDAESYSTSELSINVRGFEGDKSFIFSSYKNLINPLVLFGQSISSQDISQAIDDNGTVAKYVGFQHSKSHYSGFLVWRKNNWTMVLGLSDTSKEELLQLARSIDQSFQSE